MNGPDHPLRASLRIDQRWDGSPAPAASWAQVELELGPTGLALHSHAPFHNDPPPARPPGRCPGLWEFEVLELFLLGANQHYLELEFGPGGHYLALHFHGARNAINEDLELQPSMVQQGGHWLCRCFVPSAMLPTGMDRMNAHRIHGTADRRTHLSAFGGPGEAPNFHRLERLQSIIWR